MIGLVRTLAPRARPAQQIAKRMMGGGHHPHYVFEAPFNKVFVGVLVWGGVGFGVGAIVFSWKFQNKKQGFTK